MALSWVKSVCKCSVLADWLCGKFHAFYQALPDSPPLHFTLPTRVRFAHALRLEIFSFSLFSQPVRKLINPITKRVQYSGRPLPPASPGRANCRAISFRCCFNNGNLFVGNFPCDVRLFVMSFTYWFLRTWNNATSGCYIRPQLSPIQIDFWVKLQTKRCCCVALQ